MNMKKFFVYEIGAISSYIGAFTLEDVNNVLQSVLLIIGIASGLLAFYQTIRKKKQPPVL